MILIYLWPVVDKTLKTIPVYDSDVSVTLKYSQGNQTCYDLLDPEQGYNHTKFEKPPLNSVHQNANV